MTTKRSRTQQRTSKADRSSREMSAHIKVSELSKTYPTADGPIIALRGVSFEIGRGDSVAILGPSGCGKTTLLHILAGLTAPSSGYVSLDGDQARGSAALGLMFQQPLLFPWKTVLQNVLLPAQLLKLPRASALARARDLLALVGLQDWERRYPRELSLGMAQRVALARVLLPDPATLLLDEPFSAVDELTRETLDVELMQIAAAAGKTTVLVTHNVYEAVLMADAVYVMSKAGTIVGDVRIDLARPRTPEALNRPEFVDAVGRLRSLVRGDSFRNEGLRPEDRASL